MDGGDIMTPSYSKFNGLHKLGKESQSDESSDEDDTEEGSNDDVEPSNLSKRSTMLYSR